MLVYSNLEIGKFIEANYSNETNEKKRKIVLDFQFYWGYYNSFTYAKTLILEQY